MKSPYALLLAVLAARLLLPWREAEARRLTEERGGE